MNVESGPVVVVDPCTSGAHLAPELAARGVAAVMLQSRAELPDVYASSLRPRDFTAVLVHRGDLDETTAQVRALSPRALIAGCETGVELADQLSERLGLRTNGTRASAARRNKYLMTEAVRANGLRAARQLATDELDAALAWIRAQCPLPVILKPLHSAGTDGVSLCRTEDDVRAAFASLIHKRNRLDLVNTQILVQEFLVGDEYVIDTVSRDGEHHVTGIWRYDKHPTNGVSFVYHAVELLPADAPHTGALVRYARAVLDALAIQNGAAHSEIILTQAGPALVEVGARIHGGNAALLCRDCTGYSQIDLTVDAYLDGRAFAAVAGRPYGLRMAGKNVFFISKRAGRLVGAEGLEALKKMPSHRDTILKVRPGDRVQRTVDLFSTPGWVTLAHPDKAVVDADERRIRALEDEGLFRLAA